MADDRKPRHPVTRRDFLATSSLTLAGLSLGLPRALVAAPEPAKRAPKGAKITQAVIFPAIGICRVGNSKQYFLAPEVPGVPARPEGGFKEGNSLMKKQVQRFRVYGFDDQGRVVRELTTKAGDDITWTVHVANSKAAWYQFNSPMDMGDEAPGLTGQMRNQNIVGEKRRHLIIYPGPKSISGSAEQPTKMEGSFWLPPNDIPVQLGELRTDEQGRLLVFPGDGAGGSAVKNGGIASFSDNDTWYDDWCDGPVAATVQVAGGEDLQAESAWVTCCGPDFAPEIDSFITLYDVVRDVMVHGKRFAGKEPLLPGLPEQISFLNEIYPLFHRLGLMTWISSAAQLRQAWVDVGDFLDEQYMRKLADPSPENKSFRESIYRQFRHPSDPLVDNVDSPHVVENQQYKLPYMLGSGANYDYSSADWLLMPKLQHEALTKWKNGEFVDDYSTPPEHPVTRLEDLPLEQQGDALTRAALERCSGGAFHPGVEMTWPLRQEALFQDAPKDARDPRQKRLRAFRIAVSDRKSLLQNREVGRLMTPSSAFGRDDVLRGDPKHKSGEAYTFVPGRNDAPIGPQAAGDLTRWMGLPWYGDGFSCALAIEYANDLPNATWWPALTPIDVLPEVYFDQLSADIDDAQKLAFFENRVPFIRGVRGISLHAEASYIDGLQRAVYLWSGFGMVVKKKRPENLSPILKKIIPEYIFVETDRGSMDLVLGQPAGVGGPVPTAPEEGANN